MRQLSTKELQEISLEILKKIAIICEKQHFRYSLIYGTLLGAIRHNGFIPWDDDVDIMMPRPDYEKLLSYLKKNKSYFPNLKVFNRSECREYPYMITRISDDRYFIDMENEKPYGMGIFIDIYPFDGLGSVKSKAVKFALKGDFLSSLCYQATRKHYKIETTSSVFRMILKFPIFIFAKMIGKDFFQNKLQKLEKKFIYDESTYVGPVVWLKGGEKEVFHKEWFDELVLYNFGDDSFYIPKYYDEVLTHIYDDYLKLPHEKDRIGHHYYKAYEK